MQPGAGCPGWEAWGEAASVGRRGRTLRQHPEGPPGGGGAWARNRKSLETPRMMLGFLREATGKEKKGQKGECLSQPFSYHLRSRTPWVVGTPCVQQGPLSGLEGWVGWPFPGEVSSDTPELDQPLLIFELESLRFY